MGEPQRSSHDRLFRRFIGRPREGAGVCRSMLPAKFSARLDWDTIEPLPTNFLSAELDSRESDILFRIRPVGRESFVYLLLEHQSRPDPWMALRMLDYVMRFWIRYRGENSAADGLPVIIPLVLHAGHRVRRWCPPTELRELIVPGGVKCHELDDFIPRFSYIVNDARVLTVMNELTRELSAAAKVVLAVLSDAHKHPHVTEVLRPLMAELRGVLSGPTGAEDLGCIMYYVATVSETDRLELYSFSQQLGPKAEEVWMTTAEQLRAEGEVTGEVKGEVKVLLRQLESRFGELPGEIVDSVRAADVELLDVWVDRVLTATTLDEVFE